MARRGLESAVDAALPRPQWVSGRPHRAMVADAATAATAAAAAAATAAAAAAAPPTRASAADATRLKHSPACVPALCCAAWRGVQPDAVDAGHVGALL